MKSIKRLTASGIVIAIYINLMYASQFLSLGQIRIRVADCVYALCYIYPFLVIPMGVANFLCSLLFGGLGLADMVGWMLVGILTSAVICLIKRLRLNVWFISVPVVFVPGLLVPIWWSYLMHMPYAIVAFGICIEQIIPSLLGVILLKRLERFLPNL